jgi:hypothetical protein
MRIPRDFLFLLGGVLLLALDARAQTPPPAATAPAPKPSDVPPANPASPGVVIPASNVNAAQPGCWAKLYDAENFVGHKVTVVGPAEMPKLEGTFRSIEVGPSAVVVTFQDDDFADESGRLDAGARIANLRGPGASPEFESLKVTCTSATGK